jgi:putative transposase
VPVHIVQRGHSREPVFFENADYSAYLRWLKAGAERFGVRIHAYVLMTNHIHLLATARAIHGIPRMMQYLGRHYVPYINYTYGTSGSIWEGRYKASLIHDEQYLLTCMCYIELNPVRACMVHTPGQYRWSSYHHNGRARADELITPHALYRALGKNQADRLAAYKALFKAHLDKEVLDDIQAAWQTGTPLGNEYFREKLEHKLKCRVGQPKRGRPERRAEDDASR